MFKVKVWIYYIFAKQDRTPAQLKDDADLTVSNHHADVNLLIAKVLIACEREQELLNQNQYIDKRAANMKLYCTPLITNVPFFKHQFQQ